MPPSRTTLWWWKKKGQPKPSPTSGRRRGRPLRNYKVQSKTLWRAAILIDEAIQSPDGVDYLLVQREETTRCQRPEVHKIFEQIDRLGFAPNLVAVATCDAFRIGRRTRRSDGEISTPAAIEKRLRRKLPDVSPEEAIQLNQEANDYCSGNEDTQKWIDEYFKSDGSISVGERS